MNSKSLSLVTNRLTLTVDLHSNHLETRTSEYLKSLIAEIPASFEWEHTEYSLKKRINKGEVFPGTIMIAQQIQSDATDNPSPNVRSQTAIGVIQETLMEVCRDQAGAVFAEAYGLSPTVSNKEEALGLCRRLESALNSALFQDLELLEADMKSEEAREGIEALYTLLNSDKSIHSTPAIHVLGAIKKVKVLNKYFTGVPSYEVIKRVDKELREIILFLYSFGLFLDTNVDLKFKGFNFEAIRGDMPKVKASIAEMIEDIQNWPDEAGVETKQSQEDADFSKFLDEYLSRIFALYNPKAPVDKIRNMIYEIEEKVWMMSELDERKTTMLLLKLAKIADLPNVFTYAYSLTDKALYGRRLIAMMIIGDILNKGIHFSLDIAEHGDLKRMLEFLDLIHGFSDSTYVSGFLEGKISAGRFAGRVRAMQDFGINEYFGLRNAVLNDPVKLQVIDNLQPNFSFADLKKDTNTGGYYVLFEGHRIPVSGKGESLNRKMVAKIASDKKIPQDIKWWSARYVHAPERKFVLTWIGAVEWYRFSQLKGNERFTPLDPLAYEIEKAFKEPNEWIEYFLDNNNAAVIEGVVFHKERHILGDLAKAVKDLQDAPHEEYVHHVEVIKKLIAVAADKAFYRAFMLHILKQQMTVEGETLQSNAPQVPMAIKSRLFAADELETERRLLGIIGVGRITVDEFVASLTQTAEITVPIAQTEETPAPVEVIETVDYEQYVHTQGLKYVPTDVDVVPGTTRTPMGGEYHEYDFIGYGSYPKLRTLLEMNFDSSTIKIHATQNGYHIVHINSNINKTVVISDEQGKATYIFNGLIPVPKKGEMILSDINPELYPQIGGRIYFAGVEQVDEWKDRILERLTDPEWAIKEMKRIERLDDNMTRKCVAEMANAGIFEFVLNNQDLGKNVSKSRSANQGGHNVDWEIFLETWNMFIEYGTDEEIQVAWEKRWWNDTTRFPLFERYISHVAAKWRTFIDLHPEFSAHRLPPFNRFFHTLGGLPSLNSYKSHSKSLPRYSATMLAGTIGDDVAHVLDHMNDLIRTAAIENASMWVSLFIDDLLNWVLPRPIASDFESTLSWKTKYEARNNLPGRTIPYGLGNTTSLVIYLGGRTDEVDPSDFNAVAAFVNARIDGHKVK